MGRVGCGCELAVQARTTVDDAERALKEHNAKRKQTRWGCPDAGHRPPARLDPECAHERAVVARLAGCDPDDLGPSCPEQCVRTDFAIAALRARKWAERGLLAQYAPPSNVVFEAVDVLDDAFAAQDRREYERRERELKKHKPPTG